MIKHNCSVVVIGAGLRVSEQTNQSRLGVQEGVSFNKTGAKRKNRENTELHHCPVCENGCGFFLFFFFALNHVNLLYFSSDQIKLEI